MILASRPIATRRSVALNVTTGRGHGVARGGRRIMPSSAVDAGAGPRPPHPSESPRPQAPSRGRGKGMGGPPDPRPPNRMFGQDRSIGRARAEIGRRFARRGRARGQGDLLAVRQAPTARRSSAENMDEHVLEPAPGLDEARSPWWRWNHFTVMAGHRDVSCLVAARGATAQLGQRMVEAEAGEARQQVERRNVAGRPCRQRRKKSKENGASLAALPADDRPSAPVSRRQTGLPLRDGGGEGAAVGGRTGRGPPAPAGLPAPSRAGRSRRSARSLVRSPRRSP